MSNFMTLLTALLGSAGFALLFNVRKQLLPLAALGGALCWGAYLLAGVWTQSVFGYRVTAFVLGIAAGVSLTLSLFEMLLHAVRHAHAKKQR